jgi:hypothetical protein
MDAATTKNKNSVSSKMSVNYNNNNEQQQQTTYVTSFGIGKGGSNARASFSSRLAS